MEGVELLPLLRAVVALVFTLGLILGCAWVARRYGLGLGALAPLGGKAVQRLVVLEKTALTPHTSLYLVEEGDHQHLLAISNAQTTVIHSRVLGKGGGQRAAKSVKVKL